MERVVLRTGRVFYHGRHERGPLALRPGPIWMSTSVWAALDFGFNEPWRLKPRKAIRVMRFDGRNAHVELANLVGVEPNDDSLFEAAVAFCAVANRHDVDGWHLPDFYGPGASDTLICYARNLDVDRRVTKREMDRKIERSF